MMDPPRGWKHVLNRVFNRDDAIAALLIEQVDDHRERRRLARARHARDQHQSVAKMGQPIGQVSRKRGPLKTWNLALDPTKASARILAIYEIVDAKPLLPSGDLKFEREIGVPLAARISRASALGKTATEPPKRARALTRRRRSPLTHHVPAMSADVRPRHANQKRRFQRRE